MSYLTSHLYFMAFLTLISVVPPDPTSKQNTVYFAIRYANFFPESSCKFSQRLHDALLV